MISLFLRRIIAYVMDFFVVSAFMWILAYLVSLIIEPYYSYTVYQYFPYIVPVVIMIYFVLCEKATGATVGKSLMYIQVRSRNGSYISWLQAVLRNVTKIYWFPIIFDWAIGRALNSDRLFDVITKTVVVDELS